MVTRKALLFIPLSLGILAAAWAGSISPPTIENGTCHGGYPCRACKDCSACHFCHDQGGKCRVCDKRKD